MKYLLLFLLIVLPSVQAKNKSLAAHVHGVVHLDVATDDKQLLVMLKSPSESFLGFEYRAKTKEEKLQVKKVKEDWQKRAIKFLGARALRDCKITQADWQQEFTGKAHSTILAEVYIDCKKPVQGRELNISVGSSYPNIQVINLQLIREDGSVVSKKIKEAEFNLKL